MKEEEVNGDQHLVENPKIKKKTIKINRRNNKMIKPKQVLNYLDSVKKIMNYMRILRNGH